MGDDNSSVAPQQDWELSKENFQPLKAGRKHVVGLSDTSAAAAKLSTEEQREEYIKSIKEYTGDDPLEVWLSFIKWTQENFKAGGHKSDLLPLLERCTRELQSIERYHDDIRYLRVWIQYADCLPDPSDVFAFLKDKGICQGHALFYEAHASLLELRGAYTAADKVYQQGINRMAAPMDRLKAKFDDFQHRMARRIQRRAQEQASEPEEGAPQMERHSLAVLGGRRTGRGGGAGLPSQKRKAVATPGKDNAPAGGSGLSIFVDEEFGGPAASAPPAFPQSGSAARESAWTALPSFEQTRKENTQKASTWGGQRIKQKQAFSAPPAPALEIPQDPEFAELEQAERAKEDARNQVSLRQRLERGDRGWADEQLAQDPLRLHRAPPPAPLPMAAPKAAREEVMGCDTSLLQNEAGEEQSFEETRAKLWVQRKTVLVPAPAEGDEVAPLSVEMAAKPVEEPVEVEAVVACAAKPTPFDQTAELVEEQFQAPASEEEETAADQGCPTVAATTSSALAPHVSSLASDVTITTRGAFDAMNAAFGMRFGGDVVAEEAAGFEPTMTISTRDAFAAINSMFGNKESSSLSDVTLNTKSAFEALNAAFGGSRNASRSGTSQEVAQLAGAGGGGGPGIKEDTICLDTAAQMPQQQQHESPGGMLIREDTVFINPAAAEAAVQEVPGDIGGFDIREDTVFLQPAAGHQQEAAAGPTPGGFSIREDTLFLKDPGTVAQELSIREDTLFLNPPTATQGGLSIRDDTLFLSNPPGTATQELGTHKDTLFINPHPAASVPGLAIRDDSATLPLSDNGGGDDANTGELLADSPYDDDLAGGAAMANKWGFAPGADDTMAFGGGVELTEQVPAGVAFAPAQPAGPSFGLAADFEAVNLEEESEVASPGGGGGGDNDDSGGVFFFVDENAPPARHQAGSHRHRELNGVEPLRALSHQEVVKLGGELDEDAAAAEAALELGPSEQLPLGDEFEVFADEGPACEVVDPFSPQFQGHMLSMLSPPISQWPGVVPVGADEEAAALASFKHASRGTRVNLVLGGCSYEVCRSVGAGAYATVYQAGKGLALKVESPPCPWEWYVCKVVAGRVPESRRGAFLDPQALALGPSVSALEMPLGQHGSLQDLLNTHLARGLKLSEVVVARLAATLFRMMGDLHAARVLHNDIKPDNLLVTLDAARGGDENAPRVGLLLIDFGRGVDLELLPPRSVLCGDCCTDGFRCVEMREGLPWLWQADAYGAAGVVHCLLFGEYMDVERVMSQTTGETSLRIKAAFRRYWQADLWETVFSVLLNCGSLDADAPPAWERLAQAAEEFLGRSEDMRRKERAELNKLASMLQK